MIDPLTREEEEILLCRPVVPLLAAPDRDRYAGTRCLITGAGGSVGSELARQIAACRPSQLVLVEQNEHALFCIDQELRERCPAVRLDAVLCDVTLQVPVRRAIRLARPDVVFHAAAYKHVTMAERAVCATARVNVLGTDEVLAASQDSDARFVLISSDKAASPRSVMGATKRFAEVLTLGHADSGPATFVVRFGNVLASSGSFVDVMRRRIRQGRPIVLTDPDASRYFMTLTEAASLLMRAAMLAEGGETFWLDMGKQVRMGDLAERLLRATAARDRPPVPIELIGLRPGEKLLESLATDELAARRTSDPRIWVAHQAGLCRSRTEALMRTLRRQVAAEDAVGVLGTLEKAVPDFEPSAHAWAVARAGQSSADTSVAAAVRSA